jgi:hypothetical protein
MINISEIQKPPEPNETHCPAQKIPGLFGITDRAICDRSENRMPLMDIDSSRRERWRILDILHILHHFAPVREIRHMLQSLKFDPC